jgi:hypothetical protein
MVSQCFACPFLTSFLSKNWSSGYQQLGSFVPSLSLEPIDEVCSCSRKVWKSRGKVAEKCQSESGNDFEHVLNMLNKYPKLKRGIDVSYVECAPAKAYYDILWVNWLDVTPVHIAGTPKLKTSASAYHRTHINIYKYLYNNIYTYIYIIWYIYIISYIYIIYISYIYISYIYHIYICIPMIPMYGAMPNLPLDSREAEVRYLCRTTVRRCSMGNRQDMGWRGFSKDTGHAVVMLQAPIHLMGRLAEWLL